MMWLWRGVFLFCLIGAVWTVPAPQIQGSRSNAWQQLISEYQNAARNGQDPGWGQPVSLTVNGPQPVVVLPIPVPVYLESKSGCSANNYQSNQQNDFVPDLASRGDFPDLPQMSSDHLIDLFKLQAPKAPELPPIVFPRAPQSPDLTEAVRVRRQLSNVFNSFGFSSSSTPPTPNFNKPMMLKGALTVPRADYTETYKAWFDPAAGASRMDFHDGSASSFRKMMPGGYVQHVNMRTDRSDGYEVRKCGVADPVPASQEHTSHPALPDMSQFSFDGYKRLGNGEQVEMWKREIKGKGPAVGGTDGEQLTYRHEMMVKRQGSEAVPMKYSVTMDSSVLGAEADRYEHVYTEVKPQQVPRNMLEFNVGTQCEEVQPMNASFSLDRSILDPIREFVQPIRDNLIPDFVNDFAKQFGRNYVDKAEETVRTNVLTQARRWIQSATRMGASFEVGVNFLADRLSAELSVLRGVIEEAERILAEIFPHSDPEKEARRFPEEFDWRSRGGVTTPRYQGSCPTCWAFAVTAAVEGALFIKTSKLVPLSEQALVDCGKKTGAHGCGRTWPSLAYDYVQEIGLPALEEYTPYSNKELKCRDDEVPVVTKISAHVNVTANSIPALKVAIRKHSPSVVIIDAEANSFIFYKKGVLYDDRCGKVRGQINHAVTAVGWGVRNDEPHFILKNSWSAGWGEGGFVRVQAPANTCGVLTLPSYPRLEVPDVVRNLGGSPMNVEE